MPELPEVETIRCQLAAALPGRRIRAVDRLDELMLADISAAEFAAALPGRRILDVQRRGKFLVLPVSDDLFLTFHLGMTGQLLLEDVAGPSVPPHTTGSFSASMRAPRTPRTPSSCSATCAGSDGSTSPLVVRPGVWARWVPTPGRATIGMQPPWPR